MNNEETSRPGTEDEAYTTRLRELQGAGWKRALNVQAPYQWNIRRFLSGRRVLDVGCGIGRNLLNLPPGSVGVDHNAHSVEFCRSVGLEAYTDIEFAQTTTTFDGMLMAHLLEHLPDGAATDLVSQYVARLAPAATVMIICPQERGFASDATHTVFLDGPDLVRICESVGLTVERTMSFPFPRALGKAFTYNESVVIASTPGPAA